MAVLPPEDAALVRDVLGSVAVMQSLLVQIKDPNLRTSFNVQLIKIQNLSNQLLNQS